ncbi:MAG: SEC-C metal-binding domain-containing protein [Alteromonadaceae bacterium]
MNKENSNQPLPDNESCCSKSSCCEPPPATIRLSEPKIGRNDPCPCNSGRKFKKCCG